MIALDDTFFLLYNTQRRESCILSNVHVLVILLPTMNFIYASNQKAVILGISSSKLTVTPLTSDAADRLIFCLRGSWGCEFLCLTPCGIKIKLYTCFLGYGNFLGLVKGYQRLSEAQKKGRERTAHYTWAAL